MTDVLSRLTAALASRYTIEREIGCGGMAVVYLAQDLKHDRQVAVKVLRPELAAAVGAERFQQEIKIAANLNHPHILPLLDSGSAVEQLSDSPPDRLSAFLYYVMPYVEGQSLRDRLAKEGELPVVEAVKLLHEVVDALAHAHDNNVVHRDMKPDNVLLSGRHALVTDFGVAKAVSEATGSNRITTEGVALGTPAYMSPEQAAADPHIDHRADIYAVGVVAYELLTGRTPFVGNTQQELLAAHVTQTPDPVTKYRDSVPPALAALVMKCLEKKAADRWQTAEELLPQLEALATPSGGVAPTHAVPKARGLEKSIAVLPFRNMSSDPDNEYFSDGITEDVITQLSKVSAFKVISRTSTMRYKQTEKSMREIAKELAVSTLLEGSVRRAGNRIRITTQLIEAESDLHLWAETYDRELTDVFAIQSEVALCVASALRAALSPEEQERVKKRPTDNMEAYDLYLMGRHHASKRTDSGLALAVEYLDRAVAADPQYAGAYAALADAHDLSALGYRAVPPQEAGALAKEAALKALALDETLPEAHTSLGHIHTYIDWDWPRAKREFERAIELNPSHAQAHQWYAHYLLSMREYDSALEHAERALELDPLSVVLTTERGWPFFYRGDFERARLQYERALEMDPTFGLAKYNLASVYEREGRYAEAVASCEEAVELLGGLPFAKGLLATYYALIGKVNKARAICDELIQLAQQSHGIEPWIASVLEALGEPDAALDWLDRAVEARAPFVCAIGCEWMPMSSLQGDPRYVALRHKIGMAAGLGKALPPD